jgi:aspartate aminotransferase
VDEIRRRALPLIAPLEPLRRFLVDTGYFGASPPQDVADFAFGNPHDMPLEGFVDAYRRHLEPRREDWFAYTMTDPAAASAIARGLADLTCLDWNVDDVFVTTGDFAALAIVLRMLVDPGDEVIFLSPPWFFYETLIAAAGGRPVKVDLVAPAFDLDPAAVDDAITPRTRAVIVNSPHNPTGRVYSAADFAALADTLEHASRRIGRTIQLISDEPYRRVVFDSRQVPSPSAVYPATFVTYSYGKVLLTPGERIGYVGIPPNHPDREAVREMVPIWQFAMGWAFANATLQRAIPEIERLSIDIGALERRRDRLVGGLRSMSYETTNPEGTFYILVRSPDPDDAAFARRLGEMGVLVLPGSVAGLPGWFRLSVTASDEMVERALPAFETAIVAMSTSSAP